MSAADIPVQTRSRDGRLQVEAGADGAVRFRRVTDGGDVLLAVVSPQREWLLYTPAGY